MNKNIRIAKQLVKLAKSLLATVDDRGGYKWIGWVEETHPDNIVVYFSYSPNEAFFGDDGKKHLSDLDAVRNDIKDIDGVASVSPAMKHESDFGTFVVNVKLNKFEDDISSIVADDIELELANNGMSDELD